jgi:hypothetical protein
MKPSSLLLLVLAVSLACMMPPSTTQVLAFVHPTQANTKGASCRQHRLTICNAAMTDQELRDLVAGLAVKSDRLDAQVAETSREVAETSRVIQQMQQQMTATQAVVAETSREVAETSRVIKELGRRMGDMASNQGDVAEEFFYNSLYANPEIGLMEFDVVTSNVILGPKQKRTEFDIVLVNDNDQSVALVGVKYKAHLNDLEQVQGKVESYRRLRPKHKDYKIFAGLAGLRIPLDVVKEAHERGIFVLKRKGTVIEVDAQMMRAF